MSTIGHHSSFDKAGTTGRGRAGCHWVSRIAQAAALAATALMAVPAAWAANADSLDVTVEIKPGADAPSTIPSVSVSRNGLPTFMSVKMLVHNKGTNTINKVVVQGTTKVYEGTNPSPLLIASYAQFVDLKPAGSPSPGCTQPTSTATNTVTCNIGQLASNATREFFLIFRMPNAGSSLNFNAHTAFSSGNSDNTPPAEFLRDQDFPVTLTTLDAPDVNKKVKTVLTTTGGDFFTGANAAVNSLNPFSTKVTVPSVVGRVTENTIEQDDVPAAAATCYDGPTAFTCFNLSTKIAVKNAADGTKLVLPVGSTPYLTILLRQDISTLGAKPYPKVGDTRIFYTPDATLATPTPVTTKVEPCTAGPVAGTPCWVNRASTIKGNKGYYEYEIRAKDNGRFSW